MNVIDSLGVEMTDGTASRAAMLGEVVACAALAMQLRARANASRLFGRPDDAAALDVAAQVLEDSAHESAAALEHDDDGLVGLIRDGLVALRRGRMGVVEEAPCDLEVPPTCEAP